MTGRAPAHSPNALGPLDSESTAQIDRLTARAALAGLVFLRLDPEASLAREYRVWLQPALFGGSDVVRQWGRVGSLRRPRQLVSHHVDDDACFPALKDSIRRRLRRGYRPWASCI